MCIDKNGLASFLYCIEVGAAFCHFLLELAYSLHSPPANEKQEPPPEEVSQTLVTNKKQGNLDVVHSSNIINPN